jgi:LmbE family N-acetylglucosaminyl deacetylase
MDMTGLPSMLAFGAHPDDVEFAVGGVIVQETRGGRKVRVVVCSRGEAGTNGTPEERTREAEAGARAMGAELEFLTLEGDAHLEVRVKHAVALAEIIRRQKPGIVLAPSTVENQHPDHWRLGVLVRDAVRLARYGGLAELKGLPAHGVGQLYFYALSVEAEPPQTTPILVDVGGTVEVWRAAMECHASQMRTRNYVELQLTRARLNGLRAGIGHAVALYPNDPVVVSSLAEVGTGARAF